MPVAELLERISSRELTQWMLFAQVEPFGSRADYIGHAIVAQTVANVNRPKNHRPFKVEEFLPDFDFPEEQSVEQMIQVAEMLTIGLGGEDRREKKA